MVGQIDHREVAGKSCRACAESAPQRASTARKCTVRTTLAPSQRGVPRFISVLSPFYLRYSWFYLRRSLVLSRGFRLANSPPTHRQLTANNSPPLPHRYYYYLTATSQLPPPASTTQHAAHETQKRLLVTTVVRSALVACVPASCSAGSPRGSIRAHRARPAWCPSIELRALMNGCPVCASRCDTGS